MVKATQVRGLHIQTPIGTMIAVGDNEMLHSLEFVDQASPKYEMLMTQSLRSIKQELDLYFSGKLNQFKTPFLLKGSEFQKEVWQELNAIPFGETRSYGAVAKNIKKPLASRAVGNANSKNPLCILIPCHRVIQANGNLGGYSSGIQRKKWLLDHEKKTMFR